MDAPNQEPAVPHARMTAAAHELARYPFPFWHYGDSIGFEALLVAGERGVYEQGIGFVHGALRGWAARAQPYHELDNTAPGHAMCRCYERTGDESVLRAARDLSEFLRGRRTIGGAYVSFETAPLRPPYANVTVSAEGRDLLLRPGAGVFVDCLHFDPPFFVHLGTITGEQELVDAGARQARALVELLQDPDSGVFAHFLLERTGQAYGQGWSRGQGWALLGLLDVLDYLPSDHPEHSALLSALRRLSDALVATQDASGHWPVLLDRRDSYLETSAALFVAAGFLRGISRGHLPAELEGVAHAAWAAGLSAVGNDGRIAGVSAAVWASTEIDHYTAVPTGYQVPWGQGPLLLAAAAVEELAGGPQTPATALGR